MANYIDDLKDELLEHELNRMLTITEASELIGVSKTTLRRLSASGDLKSYRIGTGKHRRFRKRDILKYLEDNS